MQTAQESETKSLFIFQRFNITIRILNGYTAKNNKTTSGFFFRRVPSSIIFFFFCINKLLEWLLGEAIYLIF